MSSGRKERIVIACVTFEVAKIVDPAVFYEATKIHLIHYAKDKDSVYQKFYDEVEKQIREQLPRVKIVEHNEVPVFDFNKMMELVLTILRQEQNASADGEKPDIFVNVSAGPSEFMTASLIASMMMKDVIPFNVSTRDYTLPPEAYIIDGHPVGMAKTTKDPVRISAYPIERPDEKLVKGLSILDAELKKNSRAPAPVMIKKLEEAGLITVNKDGKNPEQSTTMSYQRLYVNKWLDKGWVERKSKREMEITKEGRVILDIFVGPYSEQ